MGAHCQYPEGLSLFGVARRLTSRIWAPSFERGDLFVYSSDRGFSFFFNGVLSREDFGVLRPAHSSSAIHYAGVPVSEDSFGRVCSRVSSFIRATEGVSGVQLLAQQASISFGSFDEEYDSGLSHALHFRARDFLDIDADERLSTIIEGVRSLRCNENIGIGIEVRGLESSIHNVTISNGKVLYPAFTPLEYYQTGDVEGCKFLEELDLYTKKYS